MLLFSCSDCFVPPLATRALCGLPVHGATGEGGLVVDAAAGEAFDSMLHRDARFWGEISARKVRPRSCATRTSACADHRLDVAAAYSCQIRTAITCTCASCR